jgi:hypothetical protein
MTTLALVVFPASTLDRLFAEGGAVENAQTILYGLCALLSLAYWWKNLWPGGLTGALLLAVLMVRELDFHKRFTAMSVTRTRYYLLSEVPVSSRVIAATVLLVTLAIAVVFFRKRARFFWSALRSGRDWAMAAAAGIGLIPVAVFVDKTHGWEGAATSLSSALGITPPMTGKLLEMAIEETLELAIPVLLLLALIRFGRRLSPASAASPSTL